jgi:hypothetical protein
MGRKIKWTKERCLVEAVKYLHRYEFQLKSGRAYGAAYRNNWLDDVCLHMKKTGNWYNRCIYAYEFSDNCVYVGLTYNLIERDFNRRKNKNDAVCRHINETNIKPVLKQLTDYLIVDDASTLEIKYIEDYRKNGWKILNVAKGGTVGNCIHLWTYDKCKNSALKYKNRNEFKKNDRSAYESARINGWLNNICLHIKPMLIYWTYAMCEREVLRCKNRTDFYRNNCSAYRAALRNNWLNKLFDK